MRFPYMHFLASAIALSAISHARAQSLSRPLYGYECRMLNITAEQSMDFNFHVPVRSDPSNTASEVGWASAVVIIKQPAIAQNGFLQMLFPTGRTVWIAEGETKQYRPVTDPSAKCQPVILPNGRIGIGPG